MLLDELAQIKDELKLIKSYIASFPEWIPLSDLVAKDYGYASSDGLREYCKRNIHPTLFQKIGKIYHIHRSALGLLRK